MQICVLYFLLGVVAMEHSKILSQVVLVTLIPIGEDITVGTYRSISYFLTKDKRRLLSQPQDNKRSIDAGNLGGNERSKWRKIQAG